MALKGFPRSLRLWESLVGLIRKPDKPPAATSSLLPQEEPDSYRLGGFHRVRLGDKFDNQRYTILRKLGYGQYSTVWLAHDSDLRKHVALKLLRSDCYDGSHDIFELEMLQAISRISKHSTHPGHKYVVQLLDHFHHIGPNGKHTCLVFDVYGHHLGFQTAKFKHYRVPVSVMKDVVRQLLLGLDFLHRECGIIHTDLMPTNIVLELEDQETVITDYLLRTSPRTLPESERKQIAADSTETADSLGNPLREVIPTPLISEMEKIHVRIIDFGVSSWVDRHLTEHIQSPYLRAPEVTLGAPWSTGVDIWSLGCLVIEFIKGHYSFAGKAAKSGAWNAEDDRLAQLMEVFGHFPESLLARGKRTDEFFDKEGNLLRIPKLNSVSFEKFMDGETEALRRPDDMPVDEVPVFVDFLKGMLAINPDERKSAAEMLKHDWLQHGLKEQ